MLKGIFSKYFVVALISLMALCLTLVRINERYGFDWDQEDDAVKVNQMIERKIPLLIGPRVSNENSFFVGPYHYYFLTPFYLISRGNPWAGMAAVAVVNILTALSAYWVIKYVYGEKQGLRGGLIMALLSPIASWSAMHLWFLGWWLFYLGIRTIRGSTKYLPIMSLLLGLAINVHLVPASVIIPFAYLIWIKIKELRIKDYLIISGLFCLPFAPIAIFDLRHDFLNLRKLLGFGLNSPSVGDSFLFIKVWWRALNILGLRNEYLWGQIVEKILLISISVWGLAKVNNKKERMFMSLWWLAPLLMLARYKGAISEYYFNISMIIVLMALSNGLTIIKRWYTVALIGLILAVKTIAVLNDVPMVSFEDKYLLTSYLVNQDRDPVFNVSYNMGPGLDTGFNYLFKYLGKVPTNGPEGHLYTVVLLPTNETGEMVFQRNRLGLVRK